MILFFIAVVAFVSMLIGVAIVVIAAYVAAIRAIVLWLRDRLIG